MTHPFIVQLLPEGTRESEKINPIGKVKTMAVRDDWDYMRHKIFHAACAAGARSFILVNGNVELYEKRLSQPKASRITATNQHGLWLYMERLLQRYGHVYVPHMNTSRDKHKFFNNPTDGMVVGYQTAALQKLDSVEGPIGRKLCRAGYDSFTVSDYFYYPMGA